MVERDVRYDTYAPDDILMQSKGYMEFKLELFDEKNLAEIEKNFSEGKIDSANKEWMLDYLAKLNQQISEIKKREYSYEGYYNRNVNEYLERISSLQNKIEMIVV